MSVEDLKKNYGRLNVEFDLWKGESDVRDLIPEMVDYMKNGGYAYISEGALVVDVKEETDTKEVPPCVMRLEKLMGETRDEMYRKIREGREMSEEEAEKVAETVALAAIKYGDLSNQAAKDYVFDIDRFTSFEGDTGPYILYTAVRIKSILNKYKEQGGSLENLRLRAAENASEKALQMQLAQFNAL